MIPIDHDPLTEGEIGEYFDLSEPEPDPTDIERRIAALTQQKKDADARAHARLLEVREQRLAERERERYVADDSGYEFRGHVSTQDLIREVCDEFRDFLLEKNEQYGDSAINPVRIFSKASTIEQLLVRIDDKISRIERGDDRLESDEDVLDDLIGYFLLLKVAKRKQSR